MILIIIDEARSDEYYGIKIGELQTNKFENVGNVWVANETILQITNFRFPLPKGWKIFLFLSFIIIFYCYHYFE